MPLGAGSWFLLDRKWLHRHAITITVFLSLEARHGNFVQGGEQRMDILRDR